MIHQIVFQSSAWIAANDDNARKIVTPGALVFGLLAIVSFAAGILYPECTAQLDLPI